MNKKIYCITMAMLLVVILFLLGYRWYLHGLQKDYLEYQQQDGCAKVGEYTLYADVTDEVEFVMDELGKIGFTGTIIREDNIVDQQDIPDELRAYADKVDHFYAAVNDTQDFYVVVVDGQFIKID